MIARLLSCTVAAALLLACSAAPDQYEPAGDRADPKALHRVPLTSSGVHRGSLLEGFVDKGSVVKQEEATQDASGGHRDRRQVIQWFGSYQRPTSTYGLPPSPAFTQYHQYQISSIVPYYIPVWGTPPRIPVFFPARPVIFNPGYPVNNPPTPSPKPIPETPNTDISTNGAVPDLGNRGSFSEEDDRPVWGIVENDEAATPVQQSRPVTSRPSAGAQGNSGRTPPPPLVRRPSSQASSEFVPPPQSLTEQQQSPNVRPTVPEATMRPNQETQSSTGQPNRCVWAIVSCCRPSSLDIRYNCFEQLGCPGSFWDRNPCSKEFTVAAIKAVQNFYDQS